MTEKNAKQLLDKIVGQVFGYQNPHSLERFMTKFAFDVRLPQEVYDSFDGSKTWAQSTNPTRFVTMEHARNLEIAGASPATDFMRPKRPLESVEDILTAWNEINYTTTERTIESLHVSESDHVTHSENVYRSQDIHHSKNILFSDGLHECESVVASQRSAKSTYCVRIEDSGGCTNSFGVSWSGNVTNCFFMHDTGDMQDSMFCTNIKGKRFCVANMQYSEEEYKKIKQVVAGWILTA